MEEYQSVKELNEKCYVSHADFVKNRIFGLKVEPVSTDVLDIDGQFEGTMTKLRAIEDDEFHVVLEENRFGYHLEDGIRHLVLFASGSIGKELVETVIEMEFPNHEHLWWTNPVHSKCHSLIKIWHAQILIDMRSDLQCPCVE